MSRYIDEMIENNKQKNYMFDVDDCFYLKEHIKKNDNALNTHYEFDDEAILFLVKNGFADTINLLSNNNHCINITYLYNDEINSIAKITKSKLTKRILELYNADKLSNMPNIDASINEIKNLTNPYMANLPEDYVVSIDNEKFTVKSKDLLDFITFGYKEYNLKSCKTINNIDKNKFFYIVKHFSNNCQLNDKYIFSDSTKALMNDIIVDKYANTYPINRILNTCDNNLFDTFISQDLMDEIYKDMPKNYNTLQKAIYTYIKLCKVLTYDAEFYASNQRGSIAREHQNIERLASITSQNPKIVCYEFTQIYAKMLNILGINYEINERSEEYGDSHTNLTFRVEDYIIFADSVTSILGGDLYNAKINNDLVGLICKNKNEQMVKNYRKQYKKIYTDIIEKEEIKKSDEAVFEEFLDMFDTLCETEKVDFAKKISVFEKQSKNIDLPDIEKMTYLMRLSKAVFENEASKNQFEVTIVSQKVINGFNITTAPMLVFSFNDKSFKENQDGTYYKILDSQNKLVTIPKQDLINGFSCGTYKYITSGVKNLHTLPGLEMEGAGNVR